MALAIASSNPGPVAVIHPGQRPAGRGPVVVGVDGSPTSDSALAFAFEAAVSRGADLVAVHSWNEARVDAAVPAHEIIIDDAQIDEDEAASLSERLAPWRERYPDVAVRPTIARGRSTPTRLHYAHDAQLIVVCSRGRGGFAGLLLGSTSHGLIARSPCPVVVIPPGPR